MRRALGVAVVLAIAVALPTTASAAGWRGVVVAKEKNRATIVTTSKSGVVRTLRAGKTLAKVRVGQRVAVKATRLADGTFRLQNLRVVGKASRAHVRATVVRHQTRLGRLVVSAGGSVFALGTSGRRLSHDDGDGFDPGDLLDLHLDIDDDLEIDDVDEVGHAGLLELEGIFLETVGSTLKLAVVHRGAVSVAVPGGFVLPLLHPGDELELLVSVAPDGAFTLMSVRNEDEDDDDEDENEDHGVDLDEGDDEVEVKGTLVGVVDGIVSVQPGGGASVVRCSLGGRTLPAGVGPGDFVEMECELVNGALVVKRIEADDDDEAEDEDHSGPGGSDDDEHEDGNSGPGSGGEEEDD